MKNGVVRVTFREMEIWNFSRFLATLMGMQGYLLEHFEKSHERRCHQASRLVLPDNTDPAGLNNREFNSP